LLTKKWLELNENKAMNMIVFSHWRSVALSRILKSPNTGNYHNI
jgi:hypothetical protein